MSCWVRGCHRYSAQKCCAFLFHQRTVCLMSLAFYASTIINVSLLIILCIGFTFTYMMEKFPNFAHTGYSAIGTVTTFYLVRFYNFNPYATWPVSAFVGGTVGVLLYLVIVRPIKYRGNREITLTFTFYIISVMISSFLAIFSFWILMNTRVRAAGFIMRSHDFRIWVEGAPRCLHGRPSA